MRSTQAITIQANTPVIGASGGRTFSWADLADHVDIPATVVSVLREDAAADMTVLEDQYQVRLEGPYPAIVTGMRVFDGAVGYDIRKVRIGEFGHRRTLLDCVKVSI